MRGGLSIASDNIIRGVRVKGISVNLNDFMFLLNFRQKHMIFFTHIAVFFKRKLTQNQSLFYSKDIEGQW